MNIQNLTAQPQAARLMYCSACKIPTVHHRVGNTNTFACWCGSVRNEPTAQESIDARQAEILQAIELGIIEPDSDAYGELAELGMWLEDGSDTSMNNQLFDAGYPGRVY